VVICVLDTGCDLGHPDLDFVNDGINLGDPAANGGPIAGPTTAAGHGTWCAGIAAATIHNATGVAGVAGRCRILPVAFQNWTFVELARGIRYAAQNGAHVLSMSIAFSNDSMGRGIVDPAIQEAFDLNVVMCAATGNDNGPINYPATNPLVIACGATCPDDNRISPTSPANWLPDAQGSNFGPQINVVAPGIDIPTTDIQGSAGFGTGDYINFWGTSAATPHVAGLAALLISANTTLTNVEVQTIIERTADKVGDRRYLLSGSNGTWNEEMGYGRINAYKALRAAVIRGGIFGSKAEADKSGVFDTKGELADKMTQLERPVDPGEELKQVGGYENPFGFDRRILEHILERLENLEGRTDAGQPFIPRSERPDVGGSIARRAGENE
jgi:subtilisin family serine protease